MRVVSAKGVLWKPRVTVKEFLSNGIWQLLGCIMICVGVTLECQESLKSVLGASTEMNVECKKTLVHNPCMFV